MQDAEHRVLGGLVGKQVRAAPQAADRARDHDAAGAVLAIDAADRDLERSVDALIALANQRGGTDNITVILARVDANGDANGDAKAA
jgi:serine/threonine protein phosphatase PrpC